MESLAIDVLGATFKVSELVAVSPLSENTYMIKLIFKGGYIEVYDDEAQFHYLQSARGYNERLRLRRAYNLCRDALYFEQAEVNKRWHLFQEWVERDEEKRKDLKDSAKLEEERREERRLRDENRKLRDRVDELKKRKWWGRY